MNRIAIVFLLVIAPVLAILLAVLGLETLPANPLGWFLLLVGVVYVAGLVIVCWIRRERFWESTLSGATIHEEHGDRSYWLITAGMGLAFFVPPAEYLFFAAWLPRNLGVAYLGLALICLGAALFVWARRTLGRSYSGHIGVKADQTLAQSGPYRFIRHPAYAGYLWMALGLCLGYSSLAGLILILALLLPAMVYRMNVEEKLLTVHFGEAYRRYMRKTVRLIPGVW